MKMNLFTTTASFEYSLDDIQKRKKASCIIIFLLIVSLALYFFIPKQSGVSIPFFYLSFLFMLLSNWIYFKAKKKKNYLDFDTIFIFVYCLVGFSTTFVYNNELLFRAIFIAFPVDEEYINIANLLFLIGLQMYMLGSLRNIFVENFQKHKSLVIDTQLLAIIIFLLSIAFCASGGISYYRSVYNAGVESQGPGVSVHILLLLIATSIATIATEFYNKRIHSSYKINRLSIISILCVIFLLLWSGNRTAASQLLLPTICLYTLLFRSISFKYFVGFSIVGIVFMWIIQNTRSETELDLRSPIMLITDLTIPARTTYSAFAYTEEYGHTFGKSMAMGIVGVVPLLPSFVAKDNNQLLKGSAELLTDYTFDTHKISEEVRIGLGITIIADIYLSFGLIGVILLMYFLGYFVNKFTIQALHIEYYSIVVMGGLLANTIFMIRASYTHPIRYILWALVIANLNKGLTTRWKK